MLRGVVYRLTESLASMGHSSIWKLICAISVCNTLTVGVHISSTPSIRGPGSATGLYQIIWGSAQVDIMLGSKLCSRKEHTHQQRIIKVPSVSHAAWTYCRTGKSFKMLKGGGGG